jgi:uncharacterized membrane protein YuzA (DUF378 family)
MAKNKPNALDFISLVFLILSSIFWGLNVFGIDVINCLIGTCILGRLFEIIILGFTLYSLVRVWKMG